MDNHARRLTDAQVRNARPNDKAYKLTDGGGLYLYVQPNGARLWRYKFRVNGREGLLAIGTYPDVSLVAARTAHREARTLVANGQNPVKIRQEERRLSEQAELRARTGLFGSVVELWRATTDPQLAANSIKQRDREIKNYLTPEFGRLPIQNVRRVELAKLLTTVESRAPEVARNLRNYLNGIFEYAISMGLIEANPVPPPKLLKKRNAVPFAAMAVNQIPGFLRAVDSCSAEPTTKAAIMLVVLTACRKNEVTGAAWSEFDLEKGEWLIPADRMKTRREHWVPLSRQALAVLAELKSTSRTPLLFPNRRDPTKPMANRSLNALLERLGFTEETVHGFRSVFSTHFNAAGANPDVVERCLAHSPKDKVRAAYNRHQYQDERRAMLQQWADYLDKLRNPVLILAA